MYGGIKENFRRQFQDKLECPFNCQISHIDSQENLLVCSVLTENIDTLDIQYSDIFSNIQKQYKAVIVYMKILQRRDQLLNTQREKIL